MSRSDGRKASESGASIDRREFIGAAGGLALTALLPMSAIVAAPTRAGGALLSDWTIDDMWGVYARYADPIGFGRRDGQQDLITGYDAADAGFIA